MTHVATGIDTLAVCPRGGGPDDLGLIHDAALVWEGATIRWVGPRAALPLDPEADGVTHHRLGGGLVTPGLIDCHTHLAFGGWRADEFALRCRGATYQEIAETGGGILSTMRATRAASEDELFDKALRFLDEMLALGVTTVEAKSGYGLSVEDELKLLRVYRRLGAEGPQHIEATCLAAHVVPPEYADDRAAYVRLVADEILPRVADDDLASAVDVFVEDGAFTPDEARTIIEAGARLGMRTHLHVDQLSDGGGAALSAEVGALSADHLEHASEAGIRAMAEAGTVAVALPLATVYLRQPPPDVRRWIEAGVRVAVATDFNPGSAPSLHLPFALTLACTMMRMTPAQALRGATLNAAEALGLADRLGALESGKRADFVVLDAPSVEHWLYHLRANAVRSVYVGGERMVG